MRKPWASKCRSTAQRRCCGADIHGDIRFSARRVAWSMVLVQGNPASRAAWDTRSSRWTSRLTELTGHRPGTFRWSYMRIASVESWMHAVNRSYWWGTAWAVSSYRVRRRSSVAAEGIEKPPGLCGSLSASEWRNDSRGNANRGERSSDDGPGYQRGRQRCSSESGIGTTRVLRRLRGQRRGIGAYAARATGDGSQRYPTVHGGRELGPCSSILY